MPRFANVRQRTREKNLRVKIFVTPNFSMRFNK